MRLGVGCRLFTKLTRRLENEMRFFVALCFFLFALGGCVTPPQVPSAGSPTPAPSASPAPSSSPVQAPVGAIPNFAPEWSKFTLSFVKSHLAQFDKAEKDMQRFCPNYLQFNQDQRSVAWGYLIGAIVQYESGYDPTDGMTETNGDVSQGLLQLTYGNAHCPKSKAQGDLNDPIVNLNCGLQIMADYVSEDAVVAGGGYVQYGAPPAKGAARYWSVIRIRDSKRTHHLPDIMALTAKAPGCK